MAFNIIHCLVVIFLVHSIESVTESFQTVCVSVVFRHGDRAPADDGNELYPNDPYKNYNFHPEGLGGLTNAGKMREYELGKVLRLEYNDFLGDIYMPSMVMGRSTDYIRTRMSLMLVLSSLFPPRNEQRWNPMLNWQPIPVSYVPEKDDVLMVSENCPKYVAELERVQNLTEVQAQIEKFHPLMENLTYWTGKNIKTPKDMYNLYHSLMAEYSMGLELPKWTRDIFPYGALWSGTILAYQIDNYNTNLRKLYGGMLLRNITHTMYGIANKKIKNAPKINLFSGHETNVASLLLSLGVYKPHVPHYASGVILELFRDNNNKYYVGLRHYLGIPSTIEELRIPNCDINCPLEDFMRLLKDVIPSDDDMNCS